MPDQVDRARLLYHLGRDRQAIVVLHEALADEPGRSDAHCWLALCESRLGRHAGALEAAQRAVSLAPALPWPYQVLATVLMRTGRRGEALAACDEAVRLDPRWAPYHATRAWVLIGLRRYRDALAAAEEGLRLDPQEPTCGRMRGRALLNMRKSRAAEAALLAALRWHPQDPDLHQLLGWMMLRRRRFREAAHHYRDSLRLSPENEEVQYALREADEFLQIRQGGLNALRVLGRRLARMRQPRRPVDAPLQRGSEMPPETATGSPGAYAGWSSLNPVRQLWPAKRAAASGATRVWHLLQRLGEPFVHITALSVRRRRQRLNREQAGWARLAAVFLVTVVVGIVSGVLSRSADTGQGVWALCSLALPVTVTVNASSRRRMVGAMTGALILATALSLILFGIDENGALGSAGAGGFLITWLLSL
ncbi:MAG: tetratricopeptide repeat protein, partial [Dehalococcoidia bacterium]